MVKVDVICYVKYEIIFQGTSKAMPWLAELMESGESSLDVLPTQCLCEFLMMSSIDPALANAADPKAKHTKVSFIPFLNIFFLKRFNCAKIFK